MIWVIIVISFLLLSGVYTAYLFLSPRNRMSEKMVDNRLKRRTADTQRDALHPVVFSIADSAEQLVQSVLPRMKEKNQKFFFHSSNITYEYLYADQEKINQILTNILTNSTEYTENDGTIRVAVREEPIPGVRTQIRLIYQIEDTGVGMSPEFMKYMYAPCYKERNGKICAAEGTGLGLAVAKQMADLMHGMIFCESQVGKGTAFTVTLNLPVAGKAAEEKFSVPVKILFVDADNKTSTAARKLLKKMGAEVKNCDSGRQAVKMAAEEMTEGDGCPIVLLEWDLTDMSGAAAAKEIRALAGKCVKIIALSIYDRSDIETEMQGAGVDGFLRKPLFPSRVYEEIIRVLVQESVHAR